MLHDNDMIMKTNIYVQQTWASPKLSQAKNENVKGHPKNLLVTLSLSEGMTCMNVLNNKETSILYTLRSVVAFHNIIHFDVIVHFTQHFEVDHTIDQIDFTLRIFQTTCVIVGSGTFSQSWWLLLKKHDQGNDILLY
jgi:hypothetical protein